MNVSRWNRSIWLALSQTQIREEQRPENMEAESTPSKWDKAHGYWWAKPAECHNQGARPCCFIR